MKGIFDDIEDLIANTKDYAEAKIDEAKLETVQKTVEIGSLLITWILLGLVGLIVFVGVSILAGLLLTKLFESALIGFSIVAGIYVIVFIILYAQRDKLSEEIFPNIIYGKYLNARKKS